MNWWHRQVGNYPQWMGEGQVLTARLASLLPKLTPEHRLTLKSKFSGFSRDHRQQQHSQDSPGRRQLLTKQVLHGHWGWAHPTQVLGHRKLV